MDSEQFLLGVLTTGCILLVVLALVFTASEVGREKELDRWCEALGGTRIVDSCVSKEVIINPDTTE